MPHTPGPWEVSSEHCSSGWVDIVPGNGSTAEPLPFVACKHFDQRANAKLIAAAPDLLEALRGVMRVADRNTDEFEAARAAIKKATGK